MDFIIYAAAGLFLRATLIRQRKWTVTIMGPKLERPRNYSNASLGSCCIFCHVPF